MSLSTLRLRHDITRSLRACADRSCLSGEDLSFTGHETLELCLLLGDFLEENSQPRSEVIIYGRNAPAIAVAILSTLLADRIAVVLNPRDHADRLKSLNASLVIALEDEDLETHLPVLRISALGRVVSLRGAPKEAHLPQEAAHPATACVLFTSGSSGVAKGVEISADAILYLAEQLRFTLDFDTHTVSSVFLPLSHTMSLNTLFFPTLLAGGRVDIQSTSVSMSHLYRDLEWASSTHLALTSELIFVLYREMRLNQLKPNSSVRRVQISGGLSSQRASRMVAEMFPQAVLYKGYGLTEATRVAMVSSLDSSFFSDYPEYTPLPGVDIEIRDENNEALGPDCNGFVFIQGPTRSHRLRDAKVETLGSDGFLKTGDFGSLNSDRKLTIRGRYDGVVKINGRHVLLSEIESSALSQFPDWVAARVYLRHARERLQLFVIYESPAADLEPSLQSFRRELRLHLGLPVHTVRVDCMPRSENGKIQNWVLEQELNNAVSKLG